jgi:hypothetical protein
MRPGVLALALAVLAWLSGCALLPGQEQAPAAVDEMLGEAVRAARAPAAEQKAALARAQRTFEQDGNALNKLRLAALLVVLQAPLRDDARAAELLEPLSDSASPGVGRLAAFLATQVSERQRLQRELERLARDAERAARERAGTERERDRMDKERDKREDALRQQLEALRSIERGILEREDRLRRRQR